MAVRVCDPPSPRRVQVDKGPGTFVLLCPVEAARADLKQQIGVPVASPQVALVDYILYVSLASDNTDSYSISAYTESFTV